VSSPFTTDERQRIDAAIDGLEQRTAADIALVVTRVSDRYSLYPVVWAGLAALAAAAATAMVRPAIPARAALLIQLSVLISLTLLFDWLPIRLRLVPKRVKRAHARQFAHLEFAAHAAHGGAQHILLFVSLGERYVEILADRETHAQAPEGAWDRIVGDFAATMKRGRLTDAILATIAACGSVLETDRPGPGQDAS
jgi:putative membrane protein